MRNTNAFSLVELSIVLVILGLLTGGILTGQSLIRAAELRSVVTEFQRYQTAIRSFQDKYMALPGDMRNATAFWGFAGGSTGTDAACYTSTTGTGTQTCNGDGDGLIINSGSGNTYRERFMFWQHLANAGLIQGSYSGIAGSANSYDHETTNSPLGKIGSSMWSVYNSSNTVHSGATSVFNGVYPSQITFGAIVADVDPYGNLLSPEEMWNIDTKLDDGLPAQGKITPRMRANCTVAANGSAITTSAADAAKLDAKYNLTDTSKACSIIFRNSW